MDPANLAERLSVLPEGTVLVPCADAWVRAIGGLPAEVRARYPASVASLAAVNVLVDKARFALALQQLGLPHPQTHAMGSEADLINVSHAARQHWFLKPADSQRFFARFGIKAFLVHSREDAAARLRECAAAGLGMVLQEYIPGLPSNHYFIDGFVDRAGVTRARFARRRLRMFPVDFGNSTAMVSVPISEVEDACRTLDVLFRHLGYRGIFSAEFKRDDRDGRMKLLEVNSRVWWYVEFAARCGVNVCAQCILDALERSVPAIDSYQIGRRCVFPYYDYSAIQVERGARPMGLLGAALSWVGACQPVFRWADPWPAWGELLQMARRKLR